MATGNADIGKLSYISTVGVRTVLRQKKELTGSGLAMWRPTPWGQCLSMMTSYGAFATSGQPNASKN